MLFFFPRRLSVIVKVFSFLRLVRLRAILTEEIAWVIDFFDPLQKASNVSLNLNTKFEIKTSDP